MRHKADKAAKTVVLSIRLPKAQKDAMEKAAIAAGTSLSGFVTESVATTINGNGGIKTARAAEIGPVIPTPVMEPGRVVTSDPAALEELRRIGININQIARAANGKLPPSLADLVANLAQLLDVTKGPKSIGLGLEDIRRTLAQPAPSRPEPTPVAKAEPSSETTTVEKPKQPVHSPPRYSGLLNQLNHPVSWKRNGKPSRR